MQAWLIRLRVGGECVCEGGRGKREAMPGPVKRFGIIAGCGVGNLALLRLCCHLWGAAFFPENHGPPEHPRKSAVGGLELPYGHANVCEDMGITLRRPNAYTGEWRCLRCQACGLPPIFSGSDPLALLVRRSGSSCLLIGWLRGFT